MTTFTGLFGNEGSVELINEQVFTASGTWNKPAVAAPDDLVRVHLIGAGGRGLAGGGGGGGQGVVFECRARDLASTIAVVVGAASSGDGGDSLFGNVKARGGKTATSTQSGFGGGLGVSLTNVHGAGQGTAGAPERDAIFGGGGGGGPSEAAGNSLYGGGGGGQTGGKSALAGDGGGTSMPGVAPGGGGGINASGARGEVRVRVLRGI